MKSNSALNDLYNALHNLEFLSLHDVDVYNISSTQNLSLSQFLKAVTQTAEAQQICKTRH